MEQIIQQAMNDDILAQASILYDFAKDTIKDIGGFENFVFEYEKNNTPYIIRFVHSKHREYHYVLAELEFIDYLNRNGASVSTVIHSKDDHLVEKIELENGHYFTVAVFTKAKGAPVKQEEMNRELFKTLGKETGKLHRLTKDYIPKHRRYEWYEEDYVKTCKPFIKEEDQFTIDKAYQIIDKVKSFEKTKDTYGLIHTDLHFGNMFYHEGTFTIFDWDDSSYKYFISDIAIILYYYFVFGNRDKERIPTATWLLKAFFEGYDQENTIDKKLLYDLNDFLKLRETVLFLVLSAHNFAGDHPGRNKFLEMLKNNIKNEIPFFESLEFIKELL